MMFNTDLTCIDCFSMAGVGHAAEEPELGATRWLLVSGADSLSPLALA